MACQAAGSHEPAIGMAEKPQTFPNREALRYKGTGYANVNPAIAKRIFEVTLCVYYSGVPLGEGTNLLVEGVHMRKNLLMLFASTFALAAVPAFAQNASPKMLASVPQAVAPGCGANNIKFAVKTQRGQHPFPDPAEGKALVYFIEDDSQFHASPKPTMRAGLDGQWMGATHAVRISISKSSPASIISAPMRPPF